MTKIAIYKKFGKQLYKTLMTAYSVQMDQAMESFYSGHMFSTVNATGAK